MTITITIKITIKHLKVKKYNKNINFIIHKKVDK